MITMDVKGINWVGNMYQKFENMCLEAEDMIYEDTVEYIENQIQTVGASVKKLYSDIMGDLLPSISCGLDGKEESEFPIDQRTDARFTKKPIQNFKETIKASRIDHNADNDVIHEKGALFMSSSRSSVKKSNIISRSRQYVGSMDIKSNIRMDENKVVRKNNIQKNLTQVNEKIAETKIFNEITSAETDTCRPSQCSEISNEDPNQNHGASVSNPASAEVARLASEADHCKEIENAYTEEFPYDLVQVKSAEEKQIGTSSSCGQFGEPNGFAMDGTIQSDDCSNSMVVLSHPEDELKSVPKEIGNLKANKKKRWHGFSLSKKSTRKQEYEELAALHGNSEKVKGNLVKNLDQKKLLLPSVSESEWEFL